MLSPNIEAALNKQVVIEAESSQVYLAMASWAETQGFEGVSQFMYAHSDEERMHMLKLVKFINERGGHAIISTLAAPPVSFGSFKEMFQELFNHEVCVSASINDLVDISLQEKDYATHNFLQWYVSEQIEEEALARNILDKISLIGDDKSGFYLFDNDIKQLITQDNTQNNINILLVSTYRFFYFFCRQLHYTIYCVKKRFINPYLITNFARCKKLKI